MRTNPKKKKKRGVVWCGVRGSKLWTTDVREVEGQSKREGSTVRERRGRLHPTARGQAGVARSSRFNTQVWPSHHRKTPPP
mmetsp:Transcript_15306/g.38865  ORF Transcript_15306/g.38865 Transcript_15306/m.38865 type:complete len:81 (+) Transcript_15306:2347-2589(+)